MIDPSGGRIYLVLKAKEKEFFGKEAVMIRQPFMDSEDAQGGRDPGFTFPLPTSVQGVNARGKEFTEDTVLSYISHELSSFILRTPIQIGARLRMVIDLPEKLSLNDKDLKLVLKGRVEKVEIQRDRDASQKVTVKFDGKYIIKPDA